VNLFVKLIKQKLIPSRMPAKSINGTGWNKENMKKKPCVYCGRKFPEKELFVVAGDRKNPPQCGREDCLESREKKLKWAKYKLDKEGDLK
jgi:hypothetical protein